MTEKVFQIKLNDELIEYFNEVVSEHDYLSLRKTFEGQKYHGINAWDCICSCMDRIRSTVHYLNYMELEMSNRYGNAFDFMNFMNNAAVVLDAVDMLADIFSVDLTEENGECRIFGQSGDDEEGTDKKYFQFIRSLCVVHPTDTGHHKRYQQEQDFLTCPFICWNSDFAGRMLGDEADLRAKVYDNRPDSYGYYMPIYMSQIFEYVNYRYGLIAKVAGGIRMYHASYIEELRKKEVPEKAPTESEKDYLRRLKKEHIERLGGGFVYIYDYIISILDFVPTNPENEDAVERYKNAWDRAIDFELNALRNVSYEGYENSGLHGDGEGDALIGELYCCHCDCPSLTEFSYQLSKLHYLDGTYGPQDAAWGRAMLRELAPVLSEYVSFDGRLGDWELYVLSNIALYELALDNPSVLNDSIPMDPQFRRIKSTDEGEVPNA